MKDCCNTKHRYTSGKVIEDAGALRSRLRNLISSLPKEDYWQTEAHKRKASHSYTFHSVINIQTASGTESQGTALKHSLNIQQAILNIQNWKEKMGVRVKRGKKDPNWLGISLKGKVTTTWCLYRHSDMEASLEVQKKKSRALKKSRQAYRTVLTEQPQLKGVKKTSSQNIALPSWTFSSAESCLWWTRQTKTNKF